ncbi:hypothetical protein G7Y89_g7606 [Cudoniella acicularis]|uniref:2EXR domain-containing protein n=1 Tax=Cudoniella acicularis TaxID=354080 RepID=A0A8H4RKW9_9HELO|nr:hypothetical protein G7Y89_g7606 [Cudoniella acicularis]
MVFFTSLFTALLAACAAASPAASPVSSSAGSAVLLAPHNDEKTLIGYRVVSEKEALSIKGIGWLYWDTVKTPASAQKAGQFGIVYINARPEFDEEWVVHYIRQISTEWDPSKVLRFGPCGKVQELLIPEHMLGYPKKSEGSGPLGLKTSCYSSIKNMKAAMKKAGFGNGPTVDYDDFKPTMGPATALSRRASTFSCTADSLHTLVAMPTTKLSTLPRELREEIWMLALLPDPGVYHFDPDCFTPNADMDSFEDERWMISKRNYPTVMHLCQESRRFSLHIMAQEQKKEQEDGTLPYYCLGSSARPFNPTTDTFWFSDTSRLDHPWVTHLGSVIGSRIHTIKNLALSLQCITIDAPGTILPSVWNSFRWNRLGRFVSLRRVEVVFGETWVDGNSECKNDPYSNLEKIAGLRLEKWTEGSLTTETLDDVETIVSRVRESVVEVFQDLYERIQEGEREELSLPEGALGWQDGSEITFHAAQIVKVKTL